MGLGVVIDRRRRMMAEERKVREREVSGVRWSVALPMGRARRPERMQPTIL